MKISKIIHQVYEDPKGPSDFLKKLSQSWIKFNPDWEYMFWDKDKMLSLVKEDFPDFMETYLSFPYNVQRWDAIRYLILYKHGGLYVDMDYECLAPIDELFDGEICCFGQEAHKVRGINSFAGNALIASIAGYAFWENVINEIKTYKSDYCDKFNIVMHTTGPFMITRIYERYINKAEITLIPAGYVAPLAKPEANMLIRGRIHGIMKEKLKNAYAVHYFLGSWL
jgi:mannosyltransferase OCH1-like enzyme